MPIIIRKADNGDWEKCWSIIEPVFAAGDTYPHENCSEAEAKEYWVNSASAFYVAEDDAGSVLGTYMLKPNVTGRGSHVCNCGYIVAPTARGQGIASKMCEHSQVEALSFGFTAMQFNYVVATNISAVALWQRLGFRIIGTLPKVFRHQSKGLVDAHIMYKLLV